MTNDKDIQMLNDDTLDVVNGGSRIPYIIQTGDTLGELSKKFKCSIEEICRWNNIKDPNKINAGDTLTFWY